MIPKPVECSGCPLFSGPYGKPQGFSVPDGAGKGGVLVVGEALGAEEENLGVQFIGQSGQFLFRNLSRVGIERDDVTLYNVLACRPPGNKLVGMPYEAEAILHCAPNLDKVIADCKEKAKAQGQTLVMVTLGKTAFLRVMGLSYKDALVKLDYWAYPLWSAKYGAWVLAAPHPSFLMRGSTHLVSVLQFTVKRALEIAAEGLEVEVGKDYLLDPNPSTFSQWVQDYKKEMEANPSSTFLAYDIETPYKQGADEEELGKESEDYVILRTSFCYRAGYPTSVRWNADYLPILEYLFSLGGNLVGWNSQAYDDPRIMAQVRMNGTRYDAMQMWHVLNSALPKGLGFVTPYYVQTTSPWKHLSDAEPAFYNAKDSDMTLRNFLGIRNDLKTASLWPVYERHIVEVHKVFNYMSDRGVLLDQGLRKESEDRLQTLLDATEAKMEESVPQEARRLKVYKKVPKVTEGLVQVEGVLEETVCGLCGEVKPRKTHSSLCEGVKVKLPYTSTLWAKPLEFKVSKLGLTNYQKALRHQAVVDRKKEKVTFDETAILKLVKQYPKDPLYPLILEHREYQKLLGTYIGQTQPDGRIRGGMPVGKDGRIHTLFTSNPSTLRSASQDPNLQNLPRPKGADSLATLIRALIVAAPGCILTATDYSGIEAVLVGFSACAPNYIRLAKLDVHSFYTAYALNALDGRVSSADLPLLSWSDAKLKSHLDGIKKEFKQDRNNLYKHLVHAINFGQKEKGAQAKILAETGINFDLSLIKKVMDLYKELFPEIPRWQQRLLFQVEKEGFLTNPFGYVHRFARPFEYEKVGGKWQKSQGSDANKIWAFLPQSTAAGLIKEAMLRLYFNRFEEAGQYLRLLIHDELFAEVPEGEVDKVRGVMETEMAMPVPELALPASYDMGPFLSIGVESKQGLRWSTMK